MLLDEGALIREGSSVRLTRPLAELKIPPTVQGILAARIDRLPTDDKDLLQTLAVIGKEFPFSLARKVIKKPDGELNRMLNDLQLAEFIYEQPAVGDTEYTFKHALTQEVAYGSVLVERRKVLHEGTAKAIEALYSNRLDDRLNELAHHFNRAGNRGRAIHYYQLAATQAVARSAFAQASEQASTALELYRGLPEAEKSAVTEWGLYSLMVPSRAILEGYIPDYEAAVRTMLEVALRTGDDQRKFQTLMLLFGHLHFNARFKESREPLEGAFAIANQTRSPSMLFATSTALGINSFYLGDLTDARMHLERAIELSESETAHRFFGLSRSTGESHGWLGRVLWLLGYPDRAVQFSLGRYCTGRKRLEQTERSTHGSTGCRRKRLSARTWSRSRTCDAGEIAAHRRDAVSADARLVDLSAGLGDGT